MYRTTPNEGINQRNLKIWDDVADKICFRYLKIWEWEWIFGHAVKAFSSLGVRSPWSGAYSKTWVVCLSSNFSLLAVGSSDLSEGTEITACKGEQVHKMKSISSQNGPRLLYWVKIVVIFQLSIAKQVFLSQLRQITWSISQQPKARSDVDPFSIINCLHLPSISSQ